MWYSALYGFLLFTTVFIFYWIKLGTFRSAVNRISLIHIISYIMAGLVYLFASQYLLKSESPDGKLL